MNVGYEIVLDFMRNIWGHAEKFQGEGENFLSNMLAITNLTLLHQKRIYYYFLFNTLLLIILPARTASVSKNLLCMYRIRLS
ncbi:hypothetical protein HBA_0623 [Sodalis endosymbiont of Henestaris halophilus]|nr:hypothetical protein HBA_0623 [Sodalis endosymbiont of Henestaris halophilus]